MREEQPDARGEQNHFQHLVDDSSKQDYRIFKIFDLKVPLAVTLESAVTIHDGLPSFYLMITKYTRVYMKSSTAEYFCNCAEFFTIQQC